MALSVDGGSAIENGVFQCNAASSADWREYFGALRMLRIYLGDRDSGPKVTFLASPGRPRERNDELESVMGGRTEAGSHYHRTDAWRTQILDRDEEFFYIGPKKHGFGDYYLQPANLYYDDPAGPGGTTQLLLFADRRGSMPVTRSNKHLSGDELLEQYNRILGYAEPDLPSMHGDDEAVSSGLALTTDGALTRTGYHGSLLDESSWAELSDGSRVAAMGLGGQRGGPAILASKNAPNAVEARAGSYATDMVRIVLRGSCSVGEQVLGENDVRAVQAGTIEPEIVHGPDGSLQIVILGDRHGWRSSDDHDTARGDEIAEVLSPILDAELASAQ
jgi:hypothetical protein